MAGCEVAWRSDGGELAVALQRSCEEDTEGPIVFLDPKTGDLRQLPSLYGAKPAFQPIPLGR